MIQELINKAVNILLKNKECMVAKWILDNPDRSIEDCIMIQKKSVDGYEFYVTTKEK